MSDPRSCEARRRPLQTLTSHEQRPTRSGQPTMMSAFVQSMTGLGGVATHGRIILQIWNRSHTRAL